MSLLIGIAMMAALHGPGAQDITFKGADGYELHGTITLPPTVPGAKVPGVVLLPGSGPTDRDGNQLPGIQTDILKQISATLVGAGIATLRFDKRAVPLLKAARAGQAFYGKVKPTKGGPVQDVPLYQPGKVPDPALLDQFFTWEHFVEDAADAYKCLCSQSEVDPHRVAILGHSEGAIIALAIGSNMTNDPNRPAALVTIGGTGRTMGPVIREQLEQNVNRLPEAQRKTYMDYIDATIASLTKEGTLPPGKAPAGMEQVFNRSNQSIFHSYFNTDPLQLAAKCKGPVLLVNGGADIQVSPTKDTPKLQEALEHRSSGTVQVYIVPGGSHNLKVTSPDNPQGFNGPVIQSALDTIQKFLVKQLHAQ